MPPAAPPRPRAGSQAETPTTHATLTAAAWNRRPTAAGLRGLEHWPRGLRALPDAARPIVLTRLFGTLFMALPGLALVVFAALHDGLALATTMLLLAAAHAGLHLLAVRAQMRTNALAAGPRALDAHAPALMAWTSLLPLGLAAGTTTHALLAACAVLLLGTLGMSVYGRHRRWQRPLQAMLAIVLAVTAGGCALALAAPARGGLLMAATCIALAVVVQLRAGPRRLPIHLLLVLGSVCATVAVATLSVTGGH